MANVCLQQHIERPGNGQPERFKRDDVALLQLLPSRWTQTRKHCTPPRYDAGTRRGVYARRPKSSVIQQQAMPYASVTTATPQLAPRCVQCCPRSRQGELYPLLPKTGSEVPSPRYLRPPIRGTTILGETSTPRLEASLQNLSLDSVNDVPHIVIRDVRSGRQTHTNLEDCL